MALRFPGKDPDSKDGDSPSLWYDDADGSVVVQGWKEGEWDKPVPPPDTKNPPGGGRHEKGGK
ncbi:hypothetical protein [Actinomadura formosensis]|uniref:hypothetical protein n=1 Tax=Actinomadura formosensis TaxID=60706 RepID=UPI003D94F85A